MQLRIIDHLLLDLRYSRRAIAGQPFVAVLIILTLALGIGANVAVFSVANALLLRPLNVPHPEELARIFVGETKDSYSIFSYPNFLDLRSRATSFSGIAAYREVPASVSVSGNAENLTGEIVSGNFFTMLGVNAALGRTLLPSDDEKMEQGPVVVISDLLWKKQFLADTAAVNRKILINGHVFTVVGVMPAGFLGSHGAFAAAFWAPMSTHEMVRPRGLDIMTRGWGWLNGTARLKPGVTLQQAQAEVDQISLNLKKEYPRTNDRLHFWLYPATTLPEELNGSLRKAMGFLALVTGAVLMVACANVAGILLSRFFGRAQEIAVRQSLGAGRLRIMAQLLTEALLLALIGGITGLGIAVWAKDAWLLLAPPDWPEAAVNITLDARTLLYALGISVLTGVLSAAVPLLRIRGLNLNAVLREENFSGRKHARLFGSFVIAQVALCTLLLITAALLLRSMQKSIGFNPGFETRNLIVGTIDVNRQGFSEQQGREFFRRAAERISTLPGVTSVTYSLVVPLGEGDENMGYRIPGKTPPPGESSFIISNNVVGPRYFETLGIPLVEGRTFNFGEMRPDSKKAVVINQTMARQFWPTESSIGKTIDIPDLGSFEIIGVVRDIKYHSLAEQPSPYVYRSFGQTYMYPMTLNIRTAMPPSSLLKAVKNEVEAVQSDVALYKLMTFEDVRSQQLFPIRALAALSTAFGSLALLLTTVGMYGIVSYAVRRRTREIGLRMALGANRANILRMILQYSLTVSAAGLILGFAASLVLTRYLGAVLFGIHSTDPLSFTVVGALLLCVAVLAALIPARRASKVDPAVSLRYE